jgi:DNA-binding transcriptional regulator LsrR (DeoR family)
MERGAGNLAHTYRAMGLTPDAIAKKLGIGRRLVIQMLLAAPRTER